MATLPALESTLIDGYGPHLSRAVSGPLEPPDRLVKTHCCFCGVQCGIQLKVKNDRVVGFEPWDDFPVNQGKLCPKGVARYLQNNHADRLLTPLVRTGTGLREATWDEALDRVVGEIRRIQCVRQGCLRRAFGCVAHE